MVFHLSLSDGKSPQVSRTLLSILADLNNVVVWMASTRPLISKFSNPCTNPLVTVQSAQITTGITVTFMFNSFFSSLARSRYLSLFSLFFFSFNLSLVETEKSTIRHVLFFCWLSQGLVVWLRLADPFVSQNPIECFAFTLRVTSVVTDGLHRISRDNKSPQLSKTLLNILVGLNLLSNLQFLSSLFHVSFLDCFWGSDYHCHLHITYLFLFVFVLVCLF